MRGSVLFFFAATLSAQIVGFVDHATCDGVEGWVADTKNLNTSINVTMSSDGPVTAVTQLANGYRADVGAYLKDNGYHGFKIIVPWKGPMVLKITSGTIVLTGGSAIPLNCGTPTPPPPPTTTPTAPTTPPTATVRPGTGILIVGFNPITIIVDGTVVPMFGSKSISSCIPGFIDPHTAGEIWMCVKIAPGQGQWRKVNFTP